MTDKEAMKKEMEEEMAARLKDTEREMEEMKRTWEEKLQQAQVSEHQRDLDFVTSSCFCVHKLCCVPLCFGRDV